MSSASKIWSTVSYNPFLRELFALVVRYLLRSHFSGFTLLGPLPALDLHRPWIFVANHISWWDGFFLWSLQRKLAPQRRIYTVMLAREYVKMRWFRWIGAFPIEPGSSASLRYLFRFMEKLGHPSQKAWILSIFPQGEIRPMATRPLHVHRGFMGLMKRAPEALVIPVALHIEPGTERCPKVWIKLGASLPQLSDLNQDPPDKHLTRMLEETLQDINL